MPSVPLLHGRPQPPELAVVQAPALQLKAQQSDHRFELLVGEGSCGYGSSRHHVLRELGELRSRRLAPADGILLGDAPAGAQPVPCRNGSV